MLSGPQSLPQQAYRTGPKFGRIFPWLKRKVWLSGADYHPIGIHSLRAMERHIAYRLHGPGEGRSTFTGRDQRETKELFGRLINARPGKIAFVGSPWVLLFPRLSIGHTSMGFPFDEPQQLRLSLPLPEEP